MALFTYRAVDPKGEVFEGTMDEASPAAVTAILQERGLQVNEVRPLAIGSGLPFARKTLSWEDVHLLNEQLLIIVKSELPFVPALRSIAADLRRSRLKPVLEDLMRDMERGESLEESLKRHPDSFPATYISMIRAGERSGNLAGVLSILSTQSARILDFRNSLRMALAYPMMVVVTAILLLWFLSTRVVTVFAEIFQEFGTGLPAPTQFVVDSSQIVSDLGPGAVLIIVAVAVSAWGATRLFRRSERGRYAMDRLLETVPVLGRTLTLGALARFTRSLGLLLASNVPIVESLDLAGAASGSAVLRRRVARAATRVSAGESISDSLAESGYFPHLFCWSLATGESRGQVEQTLANLGRTYEQQLLMLQRGLGQVLAPLLIIFVGLTVGFIVVSMYLPMFSLGDAISG